ncbi:MAG TPA: hypothetical protein DCR55_14795, partial [Lentisphaeria bacterium]|nr:hypothetical protein [Lentisphaeria bacterium]
MIGVGPVMDHPGLGIADRPTIQGKVVDVKESAGAPRPLRVRQLPFAGQSHIALATNDGLIVFDSGFPRHARPQAGGGHPGRGCAARGLE